MGRCVAVCIVAIALGASVVAQEPPVTRAGAGVAAASSPFAGPSIQFDDKGADFKPWLRSFVAKVRRNRKSSITSISPPVTPPPNA